ncbi:MAG: FADH(2)-oxidizing methylenetetrahydrofolate--tRNA-(uracil(54)-C(5))-methyltransferase TrmFO, partial [Hyphomicrobiaceae bacterium]|nr:FADH(2)-oxidizing methylenetetrahydrofolate--tRNA-(uracil(54)-C(5))-methyltransferase TrmFO [Hyphomicrobiaceae bacterium]
PIGAPEKGPDGKRLKGKAKSVAKKQAMARRALADWELWCQSAPQMMAAE